MARRKTAAAVTRQALDANDPAAVFRVLIGPLDGDDPITAEDWDALRLSAWLVWVSRTEADPSGGTIPATAEMYDGPDPVAALRAESPELADRVASLQRHIYATRCSAHPGRVYWPVRWTGQEHVFDRAHHRFPPNA